MPGDPLLDDLDMIFVILDLDVMEDDVTWCKILSDKGELWHCLGDEMVKPL